MTVDVGILNGFVWGLMAVCGALIGAYAAIRSDLARLHEKASFALDTANRAHRRIDGLGHHEHSRQDDTA